MATKVKPTRLQISGTPQAGDVPQYVDADNFQWGTGAGGGDAKSFSLSSTSDLTTAQAAYDWYKDGKTPVVRYDSGDYLVEFADSSKVILCSTGYHKETETSYNGRTQNNLIFNLSSDNVTSIDTSYGGTFTMYYLSPAVNYSTPYTPQYDGSPATKKYVDDSVSTLMGLGKFLSLWDATTGQPISFPLSTPYTYSTGDYFLVETISSATPPVNYRPSGSSYTGTASSTTESDELEIGDIYIYDGTNWLLQLNHGKTVGFSEIAGQPTDNTNLATALAAKANDSDVVKLTGNQTVAGTKTFSTSPVVPSKTTDATNTGTAIATEAQVYKKQDTLVSGTNIKTINNNSILGSGDLSVSEVPSGGNNGDVLTNVSGTPTWSAPSGGDVMVSTQANNILKSGMKIRAGTKGDYGQLGTYDNQTVYLTIPGEPTPPTPGGWTPGANTVMYFPFQEDAVDTVNNVTLSSSGTLTYTTPTGASIPCAYFSTAGYFYKTGSVSQLVTGANARTISVWVMPTGNSRFATVSYGEKSSNQLFSLLNYAEGSDWIFTQWGASGGPGSSISDNNWYNVIVTHDGTNVVWYINGTQDYSWSKTLNTAGTNLYIGGDLASTVGSGVTGGLIGYVSNAVFENVCWSATDAKNYYNLTCEDYGLQPIN